MYNQKAHEQIKEKKLEKYYPLWEYKKLFNQETEMQKQRELFLDYASESIMI
jgi:hypothetical protein